MGATSGLASCGITKGMEDSRLVMEPTMLTAWLMCGLMASQTTIYITFAGTVYV